MNEQFKNNSEIDLEKVYDTNKAKNEVNKRRGLIKGLYSKVMKTKQVDLLDLFSYIDEKFFSHLNSGEKEQHIFHHLLSGSSMSNQKKGQYYFNKVDQSAENIIQELLSIKNESEFIKRARNLIDVLKKNEK